MELFRRRNSYLWTVGARLVESVKWEVESERGSGQSAFRGNGSANRGNSQWGIKQSIKKPFPQEETVLKG